MDMNEENEASLKVQPLSPEDDSIFRRISVESAKKNSTNKISGSKGRF